MWLDVMYRDVNRMNPMGSLNGESLAGLEFRYCSNRDTEIISVAELSSPKTIRPQH